MVDVIDSIEVLSRTREIYVEDSPLELAVRALDVKGTACEKGSPSTYQSCALRNTCCLLPSCLEGKEV